MAGVPPPPAGFTLDEEPAPPAGFTLDARPVPTPDPPPGFTLVGEAPALETESWLGSTAVGRVLKAAGAGFREGFGDDDVGLSPETMNTLGDMGILPDIEKGMFQPIRTFNQALILPAAAALDGTVRTISGLIYGGASAIGQTADETGASEAMGFAPGTGGEKLKRDILAVADVVGIVTGTSPMAGVRRVRSGRKAEAKAQKQRIASAGDAFTPADDAPVDRAGNINLDRINAPDDVKQVIRDAAEQTGPFEREPVSSAGIAFTRMTKEGFSAVIEVEGSTVGSIHGVIRSVPVRGRDAPVSVFQITNAGIDIPELIGRGHGVAAYSKLARDVLRRGSELWSDTEVTVSAARLYEALGRRGFTVERSAAAVEKTLDGVEKLVVPKGHEPVFKVTGAPKEGPSPGFTEARRGVMSLEQTEELADALGMAPSQVMARKIGEAWNAEQLVAARNLLVNSADNVFQKARKAKGGSDQDVLDFQQAVTRHMAIQEQVAGLTAEAGRALSSFRILAQQTQEARDLGQVIAEFGGRGNIDEIADMVSKFDSPQQVSKFLMDSRKATTGDMLVEAWINALLSGPQTHIVNAVSNTAVALWTIPETMVAATIGAGRRLFGGSGPNVLYRGMSSAEMESLVGDRYQFLRGQKGMFTSPRRGVSEGFSQINKGGTGAVARFELRPDAVIISKNDPRYKSAESAAKASAAGRLFVNADRLREELVARGVSGFRSRSVQGHPETLIVDPSAIQRFEFYSQDGKLLNAKGKPQAPVDERVLFGEGGSRLYGFLAGAKDGIRAGWHTFKSEVPSDGLSKLETPRPKAIPSKTVTVGGRQIELGGKQVRIPGRLLMAGDEVFKAMGYRMELSARAYRKAAEEGLRGDALVTRMADLIENPTPAMVKAARENADYQTFTKRLGTFGASVQQMANAHPAARVVLPFIRTPVNILKFAGERTPLAVFSKEVRKDLSGANGAVARDTQIARMVVGGAVGAATVSLAAGGHITGGGPKDPRQRAMMYLTGWQPYSVRIGDMYYSYGRLEPLGTLLGVSADLYEVGAAANEVEMDEVAAMVIGSVSKNLVSKTWLQGPSDLIEAVNDPDRYGERYVRKLVGTVVPTGVAQVARTGDPELKDARTVLDAIKARIPGLSADVLPRRDIWGEPIVLEGSAGPDLISPIYESRINNDPVNRELVRLQIWPAPLQRKIRGVELTEQQYDEYQRIAGRLSKATLDSLVAAPGWQQLPDFARVEILTKALTNARSTGRNLFLLRNPAIMEAAAKAKLDRITPPVAE